MINKRPGAPVMASIKQVQYKAHHIPRGKTPRYWNEWLQLWWYRFGIETGISELEYFEKVFCYAALAIFLGLLFYNLVALFF